MLPALVPLRARWRSRGVIGAVLLLLLLLLVPLAGGSDEFEEADEVAPPPLESESLESEPAEPGEPVEPVAPPAESTSAGWGPGALLGETIAPGERRTVQWIATETFEGVASPTPVVVTRGLRPGPVLCLTAAVHGDELNGVEIVRRVMAELDPKRVSGSVIGIPIVNLAGFRRSSRYLPDRRDLNRYFPGRPTGSSAARIAYSLWQNVLQYCDALVDFHTGSFHRTNLDQLRADLSQPDVRRMARGFGAPVVVHNAGRPGTLRRAATDAGIPAITYEAGEPMRFDPLATTEGAAGVRRLMARLGIAPEEDPPPGRQEFFFRSTWVRAERGGILFATVELGQLVAPGDELGTITDPISNQRTVVTAPARGRVIGMALNQVVLPGFAAFHLGQRSGAPPGVPPEIPDVSARSAPEVDAGADDNGGPGEPEPPEYEFEERPE